MGFFSFFLYYFSRSCSLLSFFSFSFSICFLFCSTSLSLIRYLFFSTAFSLSLHFSLCFSPGLCLPLACFSLRFFISFFPFLFTLFSLFNFFWCAHFVLFRLSFLMVAMVFGVFLFGQLSHLHFFCLFHFFEQLRFEKSDIVLRFLFCPFLKKECLDSRKCFENSKCVSHLPFVLNSCTKCLLFLFELCFWWTPYFSVSSFFPYFFFFSFSIFVSFFFLVNLQFCSLPVLKNIPLSSFFKKVVFYVLLLVFLLRKVYFRKYLFSKKRFSREKTSSVSF